MFNDTVRYIAPPSLGGIPLLTNPATLVPPVQVAFSTNPALTPFTDPYFRGFDNSFPDYFRFTEWNREFQNYVMQRCLPNHSGVLTPLIAVEKLDVGPDDEGDATVCVNVIAPSWASSSMTKMSVLSL